MECAFVRRMAFTTHAKSGPKVAGSTPASSSQSNNSRALSSSLLLL